MYVTNVDPAMAQLIPPEVAACYDEPHRVYHTLTHIRRMLRIGGNLLSVNQVVAIWFHDAVYSPGDPQNESRSADLAAAWIRKTRSIANLSAVCEIIMATRDHFMPSPRPEADLVIDLDLSIFAASPVEYCRYTHSVRAEYCVVDDDVWRERRVEFLQRMLGQPRIYRTDKWQWRCAEAEAHARDNIAAEIARLTRYKTGPGPAVVMVTPPKTPAEIADACKRINRAPTADELAMRFGDGGGV